MSWDLIVFAADTPMAVDADGVADFADGWEPSPLGVAAEVKGLIAGVPPFHGSRALHPFPA